MLGLVCYIPNKTFSLKSVALECDIRNLLVTCNSDFIYKNETGIDTEALFSFPREGNCVVYYFEAIVGGKTIIGICKESEEAENMYKAATEADQKAVLIELSESMPNVFNCRIGNVPKNSEAKITLRFTMELNLNMVKSEHAEVDRFSLCLPLILRPRYTPEGYVGDTKVFAVNNKYDYKFHATITGTKEIRNIFSNNHQLKLILNDDKKTSGQVTLESLYDGTHDLDVHIDYLKMHVPSVLYEYGASSSKHTGTKVAGAFYQPDVAMLHFLPVFDKNTDTENKREIFIVVDRSRSMYGPKIMHAKECLLIFFKSLPTNCKFQIYGFGSTFDKVFSQPQLYDEQSLQTAMNYQQNLKADLGGTELMNPLNDLYSQPLTTDYTRVVFLLTDGDFSNQKEVFKLVRSHNQTTRLFVVGIGSGASTSLVQKVAESGLGKCALVREFKTLSASVIELLDVAINCDQLLDCHLSWTCPDNVSVVSVPNNIGPIFSNYFLTVFCMIKGLKEDQTIKCNLAGKFNGKPMELSLEVKGKDGISDDEFRVHRLLAKYKIDEISLEIEDGKDYLKKTLTELSLDANIVTDYTTLVAIDPDEPNKGLVFNEDQCQVLEQSMPRVMTCSMGFAPPPPGMMSSMGFASPPPPPPPPSGASTNICISDGLFIEVVQEIEDIVLYLAEKQNLNGSWNLKDEILLKMGIDVSKVKGGRPTTIDETLWMTVVVYQYIVLKLIDREKDWRLFVIKTKQWLGKNTEDSDTMTKIIDGARGILNI